MDFSLQLLPEQPLAELIGVIRLADDLGFRGCYSADETYHKDMWILFGAQQAATLDELTDGRAEIVFSIGNFALLEQYGIRWQGTRPLARLREAHEVMRAFLADGSIDFEGEFYRYSGLFTAARPVQQPMPLEIGAMKGPGSFRLAGEIADDIHVACAHSSKALSFAAESVREGANRVGRQLDSDFDLCASVLGTISADSGAAKEAARVAAARCGAHGYDHIALGLVDADLIESWSGRRVDGVSDLAEQLELFAAQVVPAMDNWPRHWQP